MGKEIVKITKDAVEKIMDEEDKVKEGVKKLKRAKHGRDDAKLKDWQNTLIEVEKCRKNWKRKDKFSISLLKKMEEANRVYSKYVFKNSFYKPVPRVNRVIKADSSVAKEDGLINDAKKRRN